MTNAFEHTGTAAVIQFPAPPLRDSSQSHGLQQASGYDSDGTFWCYNRTSLQTSEFALIYPQVTTAIRDDLAIFIQSRNGDKNSFIWHDENGISHTARFTAGRLQSRPTSPGKWRCEVALMVTA